MGTGLLLCGMLRPLCVLLAAVRACRAAMHLTARRPCSSCVKLGIWPLKKEAEKSSSTACLSRTNPRWGLTSCLLLRRRRNLLSHSFLLLLAGGLRASDRAPAAARQGCRPGRGPEACKFNLRPLHARDDRGTSYIALARLLLVSRWWRRCVLVRCWA